MDYQKAFRKRLAAHEERWPEIAEKSGVPLATIIKAGKGYTKDPRIGTAMPIIEVLDRIEAERK